MSLLDFGKDFLGGSNKGASDVYWTVVPLVHVVQPGDTLALIARRR